MSRVERAGRAALRIRVRGVVQGVGYRPFVWRLARRLGLAGWVRNDAEGVLIHAEGPPARLGRLLALLRRRAPKAAAVSAVTGEPAAVTGHTGFRVAASDRYAAAMPGRLSISVMSRSNPTVNEEATGASSPTHAPVAGCR